MGERGVVCFCELIHEISYEINQAIILGKGGGFGLISDGADGGERR